VEKEQQTSPKTLALFYVVFFVMLMGFGLALMYQGRKAIVERAYSLEYSESSSVGSHSTGATYVSEYEGSDAVLFGTGFVGMGFMLVVWAVGLLIGAVGRLGLKTPDILTRLLAVLSFVGLIVGCVGLFPPWRRRTMLMYYVVLALILAVTLPIPDEWRKKVFPGVIIAVILAGLVGFPPFPLFAGIFVALIFGANVLVLFPGLAKRMMEDAKTKLQPR